jgi:microcystin degradation protein MlrC
MTNKRVLLAGIFHETHTFVPGSTTLKDFRVRRGEELWEAEGDGSTLAGALRIARERDWEVIPIIDLSATPGPTVADEVVETFWAAFQETARRETGRRIDGVYLNLHGAMVGESFLDVEGELLRRIRRLDGLTGTPVCGVLDLHGNFTAGMARHTDALISYRENPHTDAHTAAMDGARLLDHLMYGGERPVTVWEHPPLLLPPTATGTADEPMRSLEARARELETAHPDILAVNVFAGFPYADVPEAGVSFSAVTSGDPDVARTGLRALSKLAVSLKEHAKPAGMPLEEAMRRLDGHHEGPILLVEPADNIGGGAPGDLTHVLRALLEHHVRDAGVIINDPEAVRLVSGKKRGEKVRLSVGGKSGAIGADPLELEGQLVSRSDGRFTLEDRHSHQAATGERVDMGPCAVLRSAGVTVLLTSRKTAPFDLAQWRSQGIDPEKLFAINVKAAVAHRQAYDPIARASYTLDTPGPCEGDLRRLPYRHVKRPIYPLDETA